MEQQAILESIQDEAYVKANRRFIRQERAEVDTLYDDLDAEEEAEAEDEAEEESLEPEFAPTAHVPGVRHEYCGHLRQPARGRDLVKGRGQPGLKGGGL